MRTLLVINAVLDPKMPPTIADGRRPRKDYLELQYRLGADVLDLASVERCWWARLLRLVAGSGPAQAALAWRWSGRYDTVFVDRETTGSLLGALNRFRRKRPRLMLIAHLLTPRKKRFLFRVLGARRTIDRLIVHSTAQQEAAQARLGFRPEQVVLLPYQTDTRFWAPRTAATKQRICSAGLEYRDYDTLIDAVRGMDVETTIAAASHWSRHEAGLDHEPLPPNVQVVSLDYAALRDLYAESLFVVVPLHDSDNQAGITTILEAMAMGKAVVVSHARGQTDVVRDRRHLSRTDPQRPTQPEWARLLGAADGTANGHTGIYVRPYDAVELRRAITFLLDHPEQAAIMGANGRRLVEETMGLDHFVERVAAVIQAGQTTSIRLTHGTTPVLDSEAEVALP